MARPLSTTYPTPACGEHDLVAAVRRGDDRAFEELFARYRARITSYIFGMVGDHGRAEDIAQEVFISALRRLRDTERPIAFKPWIYEIAKNACIDEFRRTRRAHEISLDGDDESSGSSLELCSRDPAPDAAIESKQRLQDLRGAFGGLSENHHRILVLRELEGRSYNEIGQQMGMTRPVVESTLFRARRRLTAEYDDLVSGRRCEQVRAVIDAGEGRSVRSMRIRERRQLGRHLAHCQPCRRYARMAGLDDSLFQAPSFASKVAALLPIPWLRLRRSQPRNGSAGRSGQSSLTAARSLHAVAQFGDSAGSFVDLGRAAAAAAAIALAGAGGGLVSVLGEHGKAPARTAHPVSALATGGRAPGLSSRSVASHAALGTRHSNRAGGGALRSASTQRPGSGASSGAARRPGSGSTKNVTSPAAVSKPSGASGAPTVPSPPLPAPGLPSPAVPSSAPKGLNLLPSGSGSSASGLNLPLPGSQSSSGLPKPPSLLTSTLSPVGKSAKKVLGLPLPQLP